MSVKERLLVLSTTVCVVYVLDCPVSQHMSQHWYTTFNIQQTTQQTTLNATYNIGYIIHRLFFYSSQMCKSCGAIGRASGNRAELSLRREFDPRQIHFFLLFFHLFSNIFKKYFKTYFNVVCLNQCLDNV